MTTLPKWATPARRARLVELFERSGGFCVFGHKDCPIEAHDYDTFIETLIWEWVADDKEKEAALWQEEQRRMHQDSLTRGFGRPFDPVAREVFLEQQPDYYLVGLGLNAFTFTRVALVRIPSSDRYLLVDIKGVPFRGVSKNKRRKAQRYGGTLPAKVVEKIDAVIRRVVLAYKG